jgi:hypothetical protein
MSAVPVDVPKTAPEVVLISTIVVLGVLHVPPADASLKVVVAPIQIPGGPDIAGGCALIVISFVATQPVFNL